MEEKTSCAVGGCPITCEYMRYPTGTEPFGCVYPRRCEYQRPLRPEEAPSPPAEIPKSFIACKNVEEAAAYMKERLSHRPPAEMPEVCPDPQEAMKAGAPIPLRSPQTYGYCILFTKELGDKKARSCEGCKVAGCQAKGRTS